MRKSILFIVLLTAANLTASAQKFALIDMEYILKNIPAYESSNEQLNQASKKYQSEVETLTQEAQALYKNYQSEATSLTETQKTKREEEIVAKEKSTAELKRKYFGPEGELSKLRESLIKPIQDEIYNAVKEISEMKGYSVVVDRASANSIIFASPNIDISNEVLARLGYSN
ncbi:OmpH family outer membrane protein [uncultured Bacteroides sp.]|uniref:OmpH family outer membrane protein n=1 Tax=uncultured Bacteroides sp. TaxID=162156 RepID=UPI002AA6A2E8|nr:OmpH family outer membrane protein [uncultured Bacteroides sp.]